MNQSLTKARPIDFEEFGYQTMLECGNEVQAIRICGLHLQAYEEELQPELSRRHAEIIRIKHQSASLHAYLYDRPVPVNDAKMLTHALVTRIVLMLTVLAAVACFAGNVTTFSLMGFGPLFTLLSAVGITALPLVVGYLSYERILVGSKWIQLAVVLIAVCLCYGGIVKLGQARRDMVDRAVAAPATDSYVEGGPPANIEPVPENNSQGGSESQIHRTLGDAGLLIMIAAEIALGFLVGLLVQKHTDEDYAAWRKLKRLGELVIALEARMKELIASIEIAKRRCMAGILRAQNARTKRHPPYHRALTVFLFFLLCAVRPSWGQTIEHYEGILIDTSGSIARGGGSGDLFREYLVSTKRLLLSEPANTRVWVSSIATDSFGGTDEILKGWTPASHGVFADDLNRARRQLASRLETKSSAMAPVASGTDMFGALWRIKALFDSDPKTNSSPAVSKEIWIFSDMMNETKEFPMPELIDLGPQQMLGRAKSGGLMVPLSGYHIHILGASVRDLTPQAWMTLKQFWSEYFSAAGAELISFSGECDVRR